MSVPSASATQPVAAATPEPPDEPPEERAGSQGLPVRPQSGLWVKPEWANSGVVVLPTMIAPACLKRRTITGSASATQCSKQYEPRVVRWPLVGVKSLKATGSPCSGPSGSPRITAASASRAWARASSGKTKQKAFSTGCTASIRASEASTRSTGETSRRRTRRACSVAGRAQRPVMWRVFSLLWIGCPAVRPPTPLPGDDGQGHQAARFVGAGFGVT